MRNVKVKGNQLLNASVISPDTVYATFEDGLCKQCMKDIANEINCGTKMLFIYELLRMNLSIGNTYDRLKDMEEVFLEYNSTRYDNRK